MGELDKLALQSMDLVKSSAEKLKGKLQGNDQEALEDILSLLSGSIQVSYGEKLAESFFNIRIDRLNQYLKTSENS